MKSSDAKRAAVLVDALTGWSVHMHVPVDPGDPDDQWGVEIDVGKLEHCGEGELRVQSKAHATVDAATGRKILAAARAIIIIELRELGVEPPC